MELAALGKQLDLLILEDFSNLNNCMVLFYDGNGPDIPSNQKQEEE